MQDHTKLLVWQRARSLTVAIHEATKRIPHASVPGLRSQILRAVMSIGTNVAEGANRDSRADFARFVTMAIASCSEVEHHLSVCDDLGLMDRSIAERLERQTVELRRMLFGLRRALLDRIAAERRAVARDPGLMH
ncbi:MAG: four helix bundle protein [Gemmatimonadaceae bacterium]|nr:four helix bundle protein [Gemmatimonadaceae bacterium]